jgi:iron complex outermembrane receptor protein
MRKVLLLTVSLSATSVSSAGMAQSMLPVLDGAATLAGSAGASASDHTDSPGLPAENVPQSSSANQPAEAASDQLGDIVVTAQKRSERLQDVPIAITAIEGEALQSRGITSTIDLPQIAPGLNSRVTNGLFQPTIRGIGTSAAYAENPTSLYIDGVYIVDQRAGLLDLNDVAQVAVLKGPQGTLFGRNSTAGVIQITTKRPTDELHVQAGLSVDNYETLHTDGSISGGIAQGLTGSLAIRYATQGIGWGKNRTTGQDAGLLNHDFSIRGKLLFSPSSGTSITLIGQHFNYQFEGGSSRPVSGTSFVYPGFGPTRSPYDNYAGTNKIIQQRGGSGSLSIEQSLGFAKLLSISSVQHVDGRSLFDVDGVAAPLFLVSIPKTPSMAYTEEVQLLSTSGSALSWVVGAFYIHNKQQVHPSTSLIQPPFFPAPAVLVRDSTQKTESVAGFGQTTLRLGDATHLTGGVRYTYEKRNFDGLQTIAVNGRAPVGAPVISSISVSKPTFRASLDHNFTPDILGYVSFNRGFKSGGYNLLSPTSKPYNPETINAYEAGVKTELVDRRLRLNVAGFYYDYSNIQISQIINNVSIISNAATARVYGGDLDFEARLAKGLTLSGGIELLHAQFTKFDNAQLATPLATGGALITSRSAAGNRLPLSQKFSGNIALDYDFMAAGAQSHFNVSASYQGDYFFEPDNTIRQPGYVALNSSLRFTLPGGRMSINFFGKNLLNKFVVANATSNKFALTDIDAYAPRTYGIGVRYEF